MILYVLVIINWLILLCHILFRYRDEDNLWTLATPFSNYIVLVSKISDINIIYLLILLVHVISVYGLILSIGFKRNHDATKGIKLICIFSVLTLWTCLMIFYM